MVVIRVPASVSEQMCDYGLSVQFPGFSFLYLANLDGDGIPDYRDGIDDLYDVDGIRACAISNHGVQSGVFEGD